MFGGNEAGTALHAFSRSLAIGWTLSPAASGLTQLPLTAAEASELAAATSFH